MMAGSDVVVRIERTSIVVRSGGEEYRLSKVAPDAHQLELLDHLYDCLLDGGREVHHEHPSGEKWFDFLGTRLWQFLHPDLALEFESPARRRVLLELGFDETEEVLNDAPWELCRFPAGKGRRELLGTSTRLAVSRLLDVKTSNVPMQPSLATQLRVLLIEGTDGASLPTPHISAAMNAAGISVERWEPTRVARAIESLEVGALWDGSQAQFDVIQVLAHGRERRGEVFIHLSDDVEISGKELATLAANRTRLVMLQSCSTAAAARDLLMSGVEGVVAMLYDIRASRLALFNQAFYDNLMVGESVDTAVQEGRRSINGGTTVGCCGAPLLYVRNSTPIVFPIDRRPHEHTTQQDRSGAEPLESLVPYAATPAPPSDRPTSNRSLLSILASRSGTSGDDRR